MGESRTSHGLQAHDIIPRELLVRYGRLFSENLPGWTITGEYNYHAAPSTQVAAVQMQRILHSGQHPWINDQLVVLLDKVQLDINNGVTGSPTPTQRLAALVNYLQVGSSSENLISGGAQTASPRVGETHVSLLMKNQWFVRPAWVSPTRQNYKLDVIAPDRKQT